MPRKKIDPEKVSKAARKIGAEGVQKVSGGRVIGKALSAVKKTKTGETKPKDTHVVYTDHTKTHTKHTRHGKTS